MGDRRSSCGQILPHFRIEFTVLYFLFHSRLSEMGEVAASCMSWKEAQVQSWLKESGHRKYASAFKAHRIDGEALIHLDNESLKDIGVR